MSDHKDCVQEVADGLAKMGQSPLSPDEQKGVESDCAAFIPAAAALQNVLQKRQWLNVRNHLRRMVQGKMNECEWLVAYNRFLEEDADPDKVANAVKSYRQSGASQWLPNTSSTP